MHRLGDGTVVVPRSARDAAAAQASAHGVTFRAAPSAWSGATVDKVIVAYNGGSEVRDTLAALGFEGRAVTATTLTSTLTSDVDVLLVGGTLNPTSLNAANRAALNAFLARGGGVVGLGTAGSQFANNAPLLTVTGTAAAGLASGVANIVNHGGPVINGAIPHAFVSQPAWYTNLGAGAVVEQSYAADPLLAGWWPTGGNNGQTAAAGKASVVRSLATGGPGPDRHQPGLPAARQGPAAATRTGAALDGRAARRRRRRPRARWAAPVPATLSLSLGTPASFGPIVPGVANTYSASTTARIVSTAGDAALNVTDPSANAPGHLVNGAFSLPQPLQVAGTPLPSVVKTWSGPTSNESVTVDFTAVDRRERRVAHRHVQQDADVHPVDHEPVAEGRRRHRPSRCGRWCRNRTLATIARTP